MVAEDGGRHIAVRGSVLLQVVAPCVVVDETVVGDDPKVEVSPQQIQYCHALRVETVAEILENRILRLAVQDAPQIGGYPKAVRVIGTEKARLLVLVVLKGTCLRNTCHAFPFHRYYI